MPGIRPMPFGHLGDGNVHFNLSQPQGANAAAFLARAPEQSDIELDLMRRIKRACDPNNILNPGRVIAL
jgi:FAD/FMN-containing dehydrogenase